MVIFVYGTTGESIKIATLVEALPDDKKLLIDTNQQPKLLAKFYNTTSFPKADQTLSKGWRGNDLTRPWQMVFWLIVVLFNFFIKGTFSKIKRSKKSEKTIVVVHGDTVTTVIGALFAKLTGVPVAHIEAGLRSGNWKHPFPEEIDRRIVSKLANINFSPGELATKNLEKENVKGKIINTKANTVADSAKWAKIQQTTNMPKLPKSAYCLISVHRNEFLVSPKKLKAFLQVIADFSKTMPVVFLDHPITSDRITSLGYDEILDNAPNLIRAPKQGYVNMMHLLDKTELIVTDSGGLQEESYYIGIPCIVHRVATERDEGIGENVVLTNMDANVLKAELKTYKTKLKLKTQRNFNPTKIITEYLKKYKYI